jgi:hypothetical protein
VKAALHGGPGDGVVDDNWADPPDGLYTYEEPVPMRDEDLGPINPGEPTPELKFTAYRYVYDRIEGETAHYSFAPDL